MRFGRRERLEGEKGSWNELWNNGENSESWPPNLFQIIRLWQNFKTQKKGSFGTTFYVERQNGEIRILDNSVGPMYPR
jgi:hypothetical protein